MKRLLALLTMTMLIIGVSACSDSHSADEDYDVAYCVDKDGKVVPEEQCEEESEHYNPALFYWLYFPRTHQTYTIGSAASTAEASRAVRPDVPTYKASVVTRTPTLRITPAPPQKPGWGVRSATPPPRPSTLPGRPADSVRPSTPPPRPVVVPRGR